MIRSRGEGNGRCGAQLGQWKYRLFPKIRPKSVVLEGRQKYGVSAQNTVLVTKIWARTRIFGLTLRKYRCPRVNCTSRLDSVAVLQQHPSTNF
jgi:hypothetical protein